MNPSLFRSPFLSGSSSPFASLFSPSDPEQEFTPRTEAQNCLAEAQERARVLSVARPVGSGPWEVRADVPYFCRATDAFAGEVTILRVRYPERVRAERAAASLRRRYGEDSEVRVSVSGPGGGPGSGSGESGPDEGAPF